MSIRSSVGVALKSKVWNHLVTNHPKVVEQLETFCDQRLDSPEGVFFHLVYVKWADDNDLYGALSNQDDSDYLICEACHDWPSLESSGNAGSWDTNPWSLTTTIEVCIAFEE